jgi:hypothetical protein
MDAKQEIEILEKENEELRKELGEVWIGAPEYESIESFVQFCKDDERVEYTHEDLSALCVSLRCSKVYMIVSELSKSGLTLAKREVPKRVRGFTTSSNDRWFGPGSEPTHGGSGFYEENTISIKLK